MNKLKPSTRYAIKQLCSPNVFRLSSLLLILSIILTGCSAVQITQSNTLQITIEVDQKHLPVNLPPGSTVQGALQQAGVTLSSLDRVDPPAYTVLNAPTVIKVTRVRETFTVQENVIPFERQTVHNESLPDGKTLLVQQGVNGAEQVTYRQVFENDQQVSNTVFKTETLVEPVPEVMMVGVQKPFAALPIPGTLVYLAGGNAWMMQTSTGERRPVVTSGDLDGRVFSLSPKGDWLLYTRSQQTAAVQQATPSGAEESAAAINSLWVVQLNKENSKPIDLRIKNVIHYAGWAPGQGLTVFFSTVEPRQTAPGWQANNDLKSISFTPTGMLGKQETILDTNMGGLYGWWGTTFSWSPDGALLAYARPDEIGLVDLEKKTQTPIQTLTPFQTGSDWAWTPGLAWSPDHNVLFFVTHPPKTGLENKEASPWFDVSGFPLGAAPFSPSGPLISIVQQAGMFAYPAASPMTSGHDYQVAYLQAIFPEQSDRQRYRLAVMDRDGSNRSLLFPPEDRQGLDPQQVIWSPTVFDNQHLWLAMNYQGNLWLIDAQTGDAQQVTGDGLINKIDWK
jgi:hypothetical protein